MHIPRSRELAPKIDPVTVDHHASSQHTVLAICNKARDAACATPIQVFDFANQSIERLAFSKTLPHEVRTAMGSLIEKSHTVVIGKTAMDCLQEHISIDDHRRRCRWFVHCLLHHQSPSL